MEEKEAKCIKNPRAQANILSALTFSWTIPTFVQGWKKEINEEDLPSVLKEHRSERLGDRLEEAWKKEKESRKNPSLHRILLKLYWKEMLFYALVMLVLEGVKLVQPLALGKLITYFKLDQHETSKKEAYYYAGIIIGCSFINAILIQPSMMGLLNIGMKIRVAFSSLIYRKTLKLSKTALGDTTIGQVVNLLANDVNKFDITATRIHSLWISPLETLLIIYLIYEQVGYSGVIGVAGILLQIPIQMWFGKRLSIYRLRTALRTDERVRLMNEILAGIQVIKMYTWEKPFIALVGKARRREIKEILSSSYIKGIIWSFTLYTSRLSFFINIIVYILLGNHITAQQVFILTTYYNLLRVNMTINFPIGIIRTSESHISLQRLKKFLFYDEIDYNVKKEADTEEHQDSETVVSETQSRDQEDDENGDVFKSDTILELYQVTAKWKGESTENTLTDINLQVHPGQTTAIVGPVGSGKTSIFHTILKELSIENGTIKVNGEISYASQEPWLFAGSIRQNILFGEEMDENRYKEVIRVCALEHDLSVLPYGDMTLIGDRGVSLSGGQKARINLARTIYKNADIYLLDDPLSAVDTQVGKQLFEECILNFLKHKTCVLITHQLQYLMNVDQIVILENGCIVEKGDYQKLQESQLEFAKLLRNRQDANLRNEFVSDPIESKYKEKSNVESPRAPREQRTVGKIDFDNYREYFKSGGRVLAIFVVVSFAMAQVFGSLADYFITYWVNKEQEREIMINNTAHSTDGLKREMKFFNYLEFTRENCIYIYSVIIGLTVIISHVRSHFFFYFCMKASVNLHNIMFSKIVYATMSFFHNNPLGRVLNRFSKDIGSIDEVLPSTMLDFLQIGFNVFAIFTVVAIVNVWLLIPTAIILVIFYLLRTLYLSMSRSVKRLEAITKSPVFSHIGASMQGISTIRAFKAQSILLKEFDNHQDLHSSAYYLFTATARAFALWLDLICVIYIAIVTLSFLLIGNEKYGGNVGLAITQSLTLTGMFQWGIRQWTELENQMTSVERVLEFTKVDSESSKEDENTPTESWPEKSVIQFKDLSLQYGPMLPRVLDSLNFTINPKEKIGIVGRTGAGKSSLIYALFQLTKTEGNIIIDGEDISKLSYTTLRSKIAIIPQDPVLFSGTLRKNLDPFDEFSDEILWKALEEVELKNTIADLVLGLSSRVMEGGSNFSVGQRQLLCLARALIRNNKILVLDEATANVDLQTDAVIQATIRLKFVDCTVLTIAHRLHTVMDSDKILVMDTGRVIEFDYPYVLLQNSNGAFYKMVHETGKGTAETLYRVAEKEFNKTHSLNLIQQE